MQARRVQTRAITVKTRASTAWADAAIKVKTRASKAWADAGVHGEEACKHGVSDARKIDGFDR